jgi:hypothetical protein
VFQPPAVSRGLDRHGRVGEYQRARHRERVGLGAWIKPSALVDDHTFSANGTTISNQKNNPIFDPATGFNVLGTFDAE